MEKSLPKISARAHTNIALIKYWGKENDQLIIPQTSSLSLTLDHFYTDTTVQFSTNLTADCFKLNGKTIKSQRVTNFLDLVRQRAGLKLFANVNSINHVPTSAGLASSASAFAALAAAASKAVGLSLSLTELSRLARRGSGSACRSIFGNFVIWNKGTDDQSSYAQPLKCDPMMDINMITVVLNSKAKKISSRKGMAISVATSPYYQAWKKTTTEDLKSIQKAIKNNDFTTLGWIAETNAMRMHALTMSSNPDYLYLNGDSIKVMNIVKELRNKGIECYYTMDAGPNVKIICQNKNISVIKQTLKTAFPNDQVLTARPGKGIEYISKD